MRKLSVLVAVLGITLLLGRVFFHTEFPYTHDGENHLARFANYKIALKEGQFPPRFAPNLMNHYGYPVFNYNYPLANILSIPFSVLKINYEITFKVIALVAITLGLWGYNQWLKKLGYTTSSRIFSLGAFATLPFLINIIWFRGNIGELLAVIIVPWLLNDIERFRLGKREYTLVVSVVAWNLFFLSHNISVLIVTPLLLTYAILRFLPRKELLFSYGSRILLALAGTLWFWLPALLEKSEIVLDNAHVNSQLDQHFPTIPQLISNPLSFGFSYSGSIDSISFSLSLLFWLSLCVGLSLVIKRCSSFLKKKSAKEVIFLLTSNEVMLFCAITTLISLFFLTTWSKALWHPLPLSNFIQFPWRLSVVIAIFALPLMAHIFSKAGKLKWLLVLVLIAQLIALSRLKAVNYFHKTIIDYDAFSQSTSTNNENLPKTFTYTQIGDWQPGPQLLFGTGTISVQSWSGTTHSYSLKLTEESIITEPTMNFLGWETYIFKNKDKEKVFYIHNEEIGGRIAYRLEAGEYQILTRFTQNTLARKVGNGISISAGIMTVLLAIVAYKQNMFPLNFRNVFYDKKRKS